MKKGPDFVVFMESEYSKKDDLSLHGNWKEYRECHILPNWLLIYKYDKKGLVLYLTRTGTHSDLFD